MLNNPNWDKIEGLVEWLEKQPPDWSYNWFNTDGDCLIGRYSKAIGANWHHVHGKMHKEGSAGAIAYPMPWTYGAALERARGYLAA